MLTQPTLSTRGSSLKPLLANTKTNHYSRLLISAVCILGFTAADNITQPQIVHADDLNQALTDSLDPSAAFNNNQAPLLTPSNNGVIPGIDTNPAKYLNRTAASNWALNHALDEYPDLASHIPQYWPQCTWFVSQALAAGGLPQNSVWNITSSHGSYNQTPGTATATVANELYKYLLKSPYVVPYDLNFDSSNQSIPMSYGDVIAYDFGTHGSSFKPDHLAIITGFLPTSNDQGAMVSEWGHPGYYTQRLWNMSEAYNESLESEYNQKGVHIKAVLLHFVDQ